MEGLTITFGQRNWKFVVEYGVKWYANLDLEKIPNIFNIRETIKDFLFKESIFSKVWNFFKSKVPFFKKSQNSDTMRTHRSVNIPLHKLQPQYSVASN